MDYDRGLLKQILSKPEWKHFKSTGQLPPGFQYPHPELIPPNFDSTITVLCVRFGSGYGPEYVERLRNMVSRHITVPYEFACLTDDLTPIQGVRLIYQKNAGYFKQWWHKVHMFDHSLPIQGRILYFDLDVIINSNIDKLVKNQVDFLGIRDFNRKFHPGWRILNSSVMTWMHGSQTKIYTEFKNNPNNAMRLHGDQDWIWKCAKDKIKFFPDPWIQSYKWEIRRKEELSVINGQRTFREVKNNVDIHPECCVAVFHGDPKPSDLKDKFVIDNWQ